MGVSVSGSSLGSTGDLIGHQQVVTERVGWGAGGVRGAFDFLTAAQSSGGVAGIQQLQTMLLLTCQ